MDRTKQKIQIVVTIHKILRNYLLQKKHKVAFKYKKAKYNKLKTLTLIVFTNTINSSPI